MAIKRHITHIKSQVVTDGKPKLPEAAQIREGEIAINYATDHETIAIKNASGNIVTFSSDAYFDGKLNELSATVIDNEEIAAEALNELNDKIDELSGTVIDDEEVISETLNYLNDKIDDFSGTVVSTEASLASDIDDLNDRIDDLNLETLLEVTYSELIGLINTSGLTKGTSYRITDYTTTTVQADTQSANHPFDIIVTATDVDTVNENAMAIAHSGDTYFSGATLGGWEIKYSPTNDTAKFAWADTTNGKGVIYYMKDEWGNECPYDFKNIQFYRENLELADGELILDGYYYTFTWINSNDDAEDASVVAQRIPNDESFYVGVFDNTIGQCSVYDLYLDGSQAIVGLNGNVFASYDNGDGYFYGIYGNHLGTSCYNNTFGNDCYSNTFGNDCYRNTFGNNCFYNSFGNNCNYNSFGNYCYQNTFGNNVGNNTFGNGCDSNTFGNSCYSNTFGNNVGNNTFGNYFYRNTFGNGCNGNTFGNSCYSNTFGNDCYYNSFGNYCYHITFKKDYCYYNIVENGNQYIDLTSTGTTSSSKLLRNITIAQGVNNTTTVVTISHNTFNDAFKTTYQKAASTVVNL